MAYTGRRLNLSEEITVILVIILARITNVTGGQIYLLIDMLIIQICTTVATQSNAVIIEN